MPKPSSLTDTDRRVLGHLRDAGADYPALIAGSTGAHIPLVERRIETLVELELLEEVTGESIYRITAAGEAVLDAPETGGVTERSAIDTE